MAKTTVVATKPQEETGGAVAVVAPITGIVAVPPGGGVSVYESDMIEADGETGLEGVTIKERRIPIMRILDPKSPQCKPPERGGIPGAKGGSIFNTSTGQVYDGTRGLFFIPAHRTHKFVKYIKRNDDGSGGGFVSIHEPDDPQVVQAIQNAIAKFGDTFRKLPAGIDEEGRDLELVETYYLGGIFVVPNPDGSYPGEYGEVFAGLVPFSSTNIPVYQGYVDRSSNMKYPIKRGPKIEQVTPKMYAHVWHLRSNYFERGSQSWYKWQLSLAAKSDDGSELPYKHSRLDVGNALYIEAARIREAIMKGNVEGDYAKDTGGDATGAAQPNNAVERGGRGIPDVGDEDQY